MFLSYGVLSLLLCLIANLHLCKAYGDDLDPAEKQRRSDAARKIVNDLNDNRIGNGKWEAVFNERFALMNEMERKRMHGFINMPFPGSTEDDATKGTEVPSTDLPDCSTSSSSSEETEATHWKSHSRRKRDIVGENIVDKNATPKWRCSYNYTFDARTQWPSCADVIQSVRDQSGCGSCWAVSSASVFTDRWCIRRSKSGLNTSATAATSFFSDADVLSCVTNSYHCDGGSPYYAFQYMMHMGVPTGTNYTWNSGCKPYPFPPNTSSEYYTAPACSSTCTNKKWTSTYVSDKKQVEWMGALKGSTATVASITQELAANGSVVGTMDVYDDFLYYSSGVYKHTPDSVFQGKHAIRLLGWGVQNCTDGISQDFWLAANSWNTDWGQNGFFLIAKGINECNIESMGIFFGTPRLANFSVDVN